MILSMKRKPALIIVLAITIVSFIVIYGGHILFERADKKVPDAEESKPGNQIQPFKYEHISTVFKNRKQEIYIIEVNPAFSGIEIKPVLSFDTVYGFEYLSTMASRNNAYAAVNAGFFHEFGYPAGMVVTDGSIITNSTGKYPVFMYERNRAYLKQFQPKLFIKSGSSKIPLDGINRPGKELELILYTASYGSSNRARGNNLTFLIENSLVKKTFYTTGSSSIPTGSMLLTVFGDKGADAKGMNIKVGDRLEFVCEPEIGNDTQAYECGSWIIRDGKIVIPDHDEWIGVMTNQDPRTAIGIRENGNVVLFAVDGRQPGYSEGMTGRELAEYLLDYGIENAAMLDGGASTEMIVKGKIVNKPSYRGNERLLGGGIIVRYKN
jgi:hypothetical protein